MTYADTRCAVADCDAPRQCRIWCRPHYQRWQQYGDPLKGKPIRPFMPRHPFEVVAGFLEKVAAPNENGCRLWLGATTADGYPTIWLDQKPEGAHRYSYERFVGAIPPGWTVDHLCRVRHCVNPEHLEAVTQAENNRRARQAKAAALTKQTA